MPEAADAQVTSPWLEVDWDAPRGVRALMSTRAGGVSAAPLDTLNLGAGSGDDGAAVAENRRRFAAALGAAPCWLAQVHGARVVRLDANAAAPGAADASITTEPGVACGVLVADCLPVLYATAAGTGVGAAHAGWRGLAAGVLEATVQALCEAAACAPADLVVWLGPCIGPRHFEVGADVLRAFGADPAAPGAGFVRRDRPDGDRRWLADLPRLAHERLAAAGVRCIHGGRWCTVTEPSRFFSFRRDGRTGRMAAAVVIAG